MPSLQLLTDQELASQLKAGDAAAFSELYERYSSPLLRHAYKWLQDREGARDVVQDLFATLWNKHETLKIEQNISGYLYNGVRNRILHKVRHEQHAQVYMDSIREFAKQGENTTEEYVRERELREVIEAAINDLPAKMRACFELSRYEHLSYAEISERLGISEETVRTQIKKALRILRDRIGMVVYLYFFLR